MDEKDLDNLFGDDTQDVEKNPNSSSQTSSIETKPITHELTDSQKLIILKEWERKSDDPPSIEELLKLAYPTSQYKLDGRSKEGKLVKSFIASQNLPPAKTKTEYKPKGLLELTPEQKEYIKNNPNEKITDIACALFNKPFLTALSQEAQTVLAYQKELEKTTEFKKTIEDEDGEEYRPPKTFDHVCARINKHVEGANYDSKKLTPTQKKQCLNLISYMKSYRFSHHYNLINTKEDKYLFENTFLKYIYNKTDLSQEDLDQYLALANEAVSESSIKRNILRLEKEQERSLDETGRLQINLVDMIKVSRDEYNACRNRQDKLYKALEIERSKRLNERIGPQFTLLNIVEAFKNEETRKKMVLEAEKRNEKLKGEIKRLSEMDSLVGAIWGADEDLFING